MATNHFRSLNRKIAISVLGVAIGFAVLASIVSFMAELTHSRNKTQIMVNQLLDTVEYSAAIAAYSNNRQIAQDVTQGLLRNDIVHKVQIKGDQALLVEDERKTSSPDGFTISRNLHSPFDDRRTVGLITVNSDAYYNLQEARHGALMNAISSFMLIALTTGIILLVVRSSFISPLALVSDTLHAIIAGNRDRIAPLPKNKNDELGRLVIDINSLLDVLETKFANEHSLRTKIEQIEKQLRNIFESTSAGLFQLDQNGKILTCNPTLTRVLNKPQLPYEQVLGKDFAELFFENPEQVRQMLYETQHSNQLETRDFSLSEESAKGKRWVHCLLSKIEDVDKGYSFEGVVFDISKRIEDEQAIRYQAEYDDLTGLLRRASAELKLKALLAAPIQFPVSVMLLDLDGFKAINDNHGHDVGDQVLIETAKRFKNTVRGGDIVARLGGDEFMIVLSKCETKNVELIVAEKISQAIQLPIAISHQTEVNIGVSIGIATYPMHGSDIASLLKSADEAMYEVKRQGKNGFAVKNDQGSMNIQLVTQSR